ncbi:MAG TPA: heavy metal-binding domain-containing protein [Ktedonobacterales bacterium]|nr:heavy metal-binding domain-containing protein [Ktedonobacterales bacterium]
MITATLSSLPSSRPYDPISVVGGISEASPGPSALEAARHHMEEQAEAMGADAVIDVRLQVVSLPANPTRSGPAICAVALIGTAIKYA